MFVVVSHDVFVMVTNCFDVVMVVVVIIPCLAACVLGVFGIVVFGMLISCLLVIGGRIFDVITTKNIPSVGFVGYVHCYSFSISVLSIHTVVNRLKQSNEY